MSLLPLEPPQKLIDIGMVLDYYGVEATVLSFKYIVVSGLKLLTDYTKGKKLYNGKENKEHKKTSFLFSFIALKNSQW